MRLKSVIAILLAVFFLVIGETAEAQRKSKYQKRRSKNKMISKYRGGRISASRFRPYSYVGVTANALNYFGDLAPVNKAASTDISFTRPGFGLFYGHKFHHSMAYRVAFNYGRLFGDDFTSDPNDESAAPRYYRNLSFRNDIKELSAGLEIYLLPNYGGPQSRPLANAYLFIGAAVFHHEPKGLVPEMEYQTDFNNGTPVSQAGEWVKLRELGTEGQNFGQGEKYGAFQLAIPVALGGELFLNQQFSVGLEFGFRKLFFDHLDDVSGSYADLDQFTDPLARIMSDRSLEPTAAWAGGSREIPNGHAYQNTYSSGDQYWISGNLGSGISEYENGDKSIRGNSNDKDMYFMTQIRITYILGNTGGRAKFR